MAPEGLQAVTARRQGETVAYRGMSPPCFTMNPWAAFARPHPGQRHSHFVLSALARVSTS